MSVIFSWCSCAWHCPYSNLHLAFLLSLLKDCDHKDSAALSDRVMAGSEPKQRIFPNLSKFLVFMLSLPYRAFDNNKVPSCANCNATSVFHSFELRFWLQGINEVRAILFSEVCAVQCYFVQ